MLFYETPNFTVESHPEPFVSRQDGGHLRISVKNKNITDRTLLSPKQAIELMRLTMIVWKSLQEVMNIQGIPVVKINYQDMGNWAFKTGKSPFLHIHIFWRSKNAVKQVFPESVYLPARESGFYEGFEPLNEQDVSLLKEKFDKYFALREYSNTIWGL